MSNRRTNGDITRRTNPGARENALKHGILSKSLILPWEDEGRFAELLASLSEEYEPETPTEIHLVEELAGIIWRKRRLQMTEAHLYGYYGEAVLDGSADSYPERTISKSLNIDRLSTLGRYEAHLDRKMDRVLSLIAKFNTQVFA